MGLLAVGIACVALWAPPDPEAVKAALARVMAERAYQTTLPSDDAGRSTSTQSAGSSGSTGSQDSGTPGSRTVPETGPRGRHRTGNTADHDGARDRGSPDDTRGNRGSSAVGAALFWVIVVVLAVLLVAWIASEWRGRTKRKDVKAAVAKTGARPEPVMPVVPLDEVEALAAAGRFGEAIHLLLLRTIAGLAQANRVVTPSLTSREILSFVPFRPGAREAMTGLVDAVEVSLFGGRPLAESSYLDCRARFDQFARLQSGAAA